MMGFSFPQAYHSLSGAAWARSRGEHSFLSQNTAERLLKQLLSHTALHFALDFQGDLHDRFTIVMEPDRLLHPRAVTGTAVVITDGDP